jgi:hypothetical protein
MKIRAIYRCVFVAFAVTVLLVLISTISLLLDAKHILPLQAVKLTGYNAVQGRVLGVTHKGFAASLAQPYYFKDLIFSGDTAGLQSIELLYNGVEQKISPRQLTALQATVDFSGLPADSFSPGKNYVFTGALPVRKSVLPVFKHFVNWAGDGALLKKILRNPLLLLFLSVVVLLTVFWSKLSVLGNNSFTGLATHRVSKVWHITGGSLFLLLCAYLLANQPWYFLQDDNYVQFTPTLVQGLEGWYGRGDFPTLNPYQLTGVPTFGYSTYAFLYPGTHVSFIISKYLFGNVWHFNTVFALLHFALGYWFSYRLLIRLRCHPLLAIAAALGFVFCGYNLMAVRSWYYVAPVIMFVPLIALCTLQTIDKTGWRGWLPLALLFALFAYAGNFQYWVYTFLFFAGWVLFNSGRVTFFKNLGRTATIASVALLLFSPQLIATLGETTGLERVGGEGQGIYNGLNALVLPYISKAALPNGWGSVAFRHADAHFYYGHLFLPLLAFIALFYTMLSGLQSGKFRTYRVLLLLFVIAFLLSLGRGGLLWWAMAKLPVFNQFNHPFKFLLFVQFFAMIAGALALQYLIQAHFNRRLQNIVALLLVSSIVVLPFHLNKTRQAFYVYRYDRPYTKPSFTEKLAVGSNYRILPIGPLRSFDKGYEASLQMNFPAAYGIASADGYEPLDRKVFDFYRHHRQWGIRYFIQSLHQPEPNGFPIQNYGLQRYAGYRDFKEVYRDGGVIVYEDNLCEPVVQCLDEQGRLLPFSYQLTPEYHNNGLQVRLPATDTQVRTLVLALAWRRGWLCKVDGVGVKPVKDAVGRMAVSVPGSCNTIRLYYQPF